jgi:hypothetical protein
MKQTAVEWQFEQLFNSFEKFNNGEYTFNDYLKRNLEIRKQAKEMEKQQIIDACGSMYSEEDLQNAFYNGWLYRGEDYSFPQAKKEWFEQLKK